VHLVAVDSTARACVLANIAVGSGVFLRRAVAPPVVVVTLAHAVLAYFWNLAFIY
jgi:hypothetical protein